jgi:hypothetical protein
VALRRPATVVGGVAGLCLMVVLLVSVSVVTVHRHEVLGAYEMAVIAGAASSVIYQMGIRPAVVIGRTSLTLRQPYSRREVPLALISRVTRARSLTLHLTDGTQVKVWAFSASLLADWLGDAKAREVATQIQAAVAADSGGHPSPSASRRLDIWPTAVVLAVALTIASVVVVALHTH